MRKRDELTNPDSCLNKAGDTEMLFVLRGHDLAAPSAIRAWIEERVRLGKNAITDGQIEEALHAASIMEEEKRAAEDRLSASR